MSTTVKRRPLVDGGPDVRRSELVTPEGVALHVPVASAGDRITAFVLDFLIINVVIVLLVLMGLALSLGGGRLGVAFLLIVSFLLRNFYFIGFEYRWQGRTPGKKARKLRVVDRKGGLLTAEAIIARNLTREIELFIPLTLVINGPMMWEGAPPWARLVAGAWAVIFVTMPLYNRSRLRIGDMVGGTLVIQAPRPQLLTDLVEMKGPAFEANRYVFTSKHVEVYGIYELQVLEGVLRSQAEGRNEAMAAVSQRIRDKIDWPEGLVDDEAFLRAFYAALRAELESKMLLGKRREDKGDAPQ